MVGSRVYVGGLPYGVRERDLERFFKGYGRTREILIKNGYGFVVRVVVLLCFRRRKLCRICADLICFCVTGIRGPPGRRRCGVRAERQGAARATVSAQ